MDATKNLTTLIKEVGLPNTIVIVFIGIFLAFSSDEQKSKFIDKFILLEDVEKNPFPCTIVVVGILFLFIITTIYFNFIIKVKNAEIQRIGEEKSQLQRAHLDDGLNSSN